MEDTDTVNGYVQPIDPGEKEGGNEYDYIKGEAGETLYSGRDPSTDTEHNYTKLGRTLPSLPVESFQIDTKPVRGKKETSKPSRPTLCGRIPCWALLFVVILFWVLAVSVAVALYFLG